MIDATPTSYTTPTWPAGLPAPQPSAIVQQLNADAPEELFALASRLQQVPDLWREFLNLRSWAGGNHPSPAEFTAAMYTELVEAMKGNGNPYEPHFQILLAYADRSIRLNRGYNHLWVDSSRQALESRFNAFLQSPDVTALQEFIEHLAYYAWRFTSSYVRQHVGETVLLHRSFGLSRGLGKSLGSISTLSTESLQERLAHRALSSWSIQGEFAEEWGGSAADRLIVSARVPAECIWFGPGSGEGEVIVSPCMPFAHSRATAADVVVESFAYRGSDSELIRVQRGQASGGIVRDTSSAGTPRSLSRWDHLKHAFSLSVAKGGSAGAP